MDCKHLEEHSSRLKNPVKSSVRIGLPEGKLSNSSTASSSTANNTNPIVCAVCGSKEYVTVHSPERNHYAYPLNLGWSSPDFMKKNPSSPEYGSPTCGPLSPLAQTIFPHLSLLHFPSNIYYSHCNSNFRFSSSPCVPVEKYFASSNMEIDTAKAANINSESTLYHEKKDLRKKTRNQTRIHRERGGEETIAYKSAKEDSRPSSAFTNSSEMRNYPFAMQPPWLGNICPIFPYTFPYSWAFPLNQPLIPVYLPVPGKWQGVDTRNEEETMDSSVSNSPMGDALSMKNDTEKKSEQKDDNNASEYDFELFARELMLDQKSNYDEDETDEVEINLDEITSSLKMDDTNSGREINSEKFFNSKEKWAGSTKGGSPDKEIQNWNLSSNINMQDCCIRTLSNENLWYEAQDGEKKIWDSSQEYNSHFSNKSKHTLNEKDDRKGERDKIGDGVFYEANTVWCQDRKRATEGDSKIRTNLKKSNVKSFRRPKIAFGEPSDNTCVSKDKRNEWSKFSKAELNDEMDSPEEKISSLAEPSTVTDLKTVNDEASKLDVRFNDLAEDNESITQTSRHCENTEKEDDYLVRMHSIEIEYCVNTVEDTQNQEERINALRKNKSERVQKKSITHDPRHFNWDKINDLLEKYNQKFTEVGVVLKNKQVLGEKMAEACSGTDSKKQKNPISDTSKPTIANYETPNADKLKKIDFKLNGIAQPLSPLSIRVSSKIKKDEKSKSFGFTSSKYESFKIPIPNVKKGRKQEDLKKH